MAWNKTPGLAFLGIMGLVLEGCPLFGAGGFVDVTNAGILTIAFYADTR